MRNIVLAVTTDLNYDQRMQRISSSLAQAGYHVLLIGRQLPDSQPLIPRHYAQCRLQCFFNKGKLFYLEYTIRIFWYLCVRTFDAYVAVDLDTALPVYVHAKLRSKPFIYDAHEYFTEVVEVINRPWIKKTWLLIEQFIVKRTHFAYTVSQSLADLYFKRYHKVFAVIRNCAVLEANLTLPLDKKEKFLLYQGALNAGRGLEVLLQAMPRVNMKLVICGKGDVYEQLQEITNTLQLTEKIIFKEYVRPEELQNITQKAFLGINLLENQGLSYYYSLGNKFFDYLHAGVPQLLVDFPEYRCLNNECQVGEIVALEPATIAAKINELAQNPAHYNQLVQNCLKARLKWNWQNEEIKLRAFYANLWKPTPTN